MYDKDEALRDLDDAIAEGVELGRKARRTEQWSWAGKTAFIAAVIILYAVWTEWSESTVWVFFAWIALTMVQLGLILRRPSPFREDVESLKASRDWNERYFTDDVRDAEDWPTPVDYWEEGPDGRRHIILPSIGDGSKWAEIVRWLAIPGDTVAVRQPLVEVVFDAATIEIPAPVAGVIDAIDVKNGGQLKIGATLCRLLPVTAAAT